MATIQHSALTGADLHEPKGAAGASANTVYVATGAGSGTWKKVVPGDSVDATGVDQGQLLTADGAGGADFGVLVWKDLHGTYIEDVSGPTRPTKAAFRGTIDAFAYSVGDAADYQFHMPHDYAPGTDVYLHVHWGHNGTVISGNMVWTMSVSYATRTATVPYSTFSTPITTTVDSNTISGTMNITNFPQYCHAVEEIQLSAASPSASQLSTAALSTDGVILLHLSPTTIPTITGGTPNEPFLFYVDLHYQASYFGTKNKDPNFYV